jgi:hypothetical protein
MPKPRKTPRLQKSTGKEASYLLLPWTQKNYPDRCEIEAYVPITGEWETIAEIPAGPGIDAELIAGFILRAVNAYEKTGDLLKQMTAALELCLTCDGKLTWEAEHEAQAVLKCAKKKLE